MFCLIFKDIYRYLKKDTIFYTVSILHTDPIILITDLLLLFIVLYIIYI